MKLDEVRRVEECCVGEANKFLSQGFRILKIVKLQNKDDEVITYVLGS